MEPVSFKPLPSQLPPEPPRKSGLLDRTWKWIQSNILSPIHRLLAILTARLLDVEPQKPRELKGRVSYMPLAKPHPGAPRGEASLVGTTKLKFDPSGKPEISPGLLTALRKHFQNALPQVQAHQFGYGIENGGNSCYVNSIAQGLRAVTSFRAIRDRKEPPPLTPRLHNLMRDNPYQDLRKHLNREELELVQDHLKSYLFQMFDALDGPNGQDLSSDVSNTLRHLAMTLGFPARDYRSQEDAQSLLLFVLDQIGVQPPSFKKEILHEVDGVAIPAFDRQRGAEMCLTLDISENVPEGTSIQDLLTSRIVPAEFEPHRAVEKTPGMGIPGVGTLDLTPEVRAELQRSQVEIRTPTLQSIQIEGRPPGMLLVSLKRYGFDPRTRDSTKLTKSILPSEDIILPLANDPTKSAHYKLRAVTIHDDWGTKSINGGHYYTYAPKEVDGKKMWFEYNDARVTRHEDQGPYNDARRNGYVFFYELQKD